MLFHLFQTVQLSPNLLEHAMLAQQLVIFGAILHISASAIQIQPVII